MATFLKQIIGGLTYISAFMRDIKNATEAAIDRKFFIERISIFKGTFCVVHVDQIKEAYVEETLNSTRTFYVLRILSSKLSQYENHLLISTDTKLDIERLNQNKVNTILLPCDCEYPITNKNLNEKINFTNLSIVEETGYPPLAIPFKICDSDIIRELKSDEGDEVDFNIPPLTSSDLTQYPVTYFDSHGGKYTIFVLRRFNKIYNVFLNAEFVMSVPDLIGMNIVTTVPDYVGRDVLYLTGHKCEASVVIDPKVEIWSDVKFSSSDVFAGPLLTSYQGQHSLELPVVFVEDIKNEKTLKHIHVKIPGIPGGGKGCIMKRVNVGDFDFNKISSCFILINPRSENKKSNNLTVSIIADLNTR